MNNPLIAPTHTPSTKFIPESIKDATQVIAVAKAMIVACAHATGGAPRYSAERAVWDLWGRPEFNAEKTGVTLTFGMADEILDVAYEKYSAFEANAEVQAR